MEKIGRRAVAKRAFKEAGEFVRWPKASAVVTALIGAVGAALVTWVSTGVWALSAIGGLGAIVTLFAGVFVVKLFSVPIAMANEAEASRAALETSIRMDVEREKAMLELAAQIRTGTALYHKKISNAEEMDQWMAQFKVWGLASHALIAQAFSKSKANAFLEDTGSGSIALPGGCFNNQHLNGRLMLREWTDRLRKMINGQL